MTRLGFCITDIIGRSNSRKLKQNTEFQKPHLQLFEVVFSVTHFAAPKFFHFYSRPVELLPALTRTGFSTTARAESLKQRTVTARTA